MQINNLDNKVNDVDAKTKDAGSTVWRLEKKLEKLTLVNQALYELLKDRLDITDKELRLKIQEIDLRDGVEDGRIKAKPVHCPKCKKTSAAGAMNCVYCGVMIAPKYPYEE